jgi:hypothetical protein
VKQLNLVPAFGEPRRKLIDDDFGSTSLGVGGVAPREKDNPHV